MDLEKQSTIQELPSKNGCVSVHTIQTTTEYSINPPQSQGFFKDVVNGFKRADLSGIDTSCMTEAQIQNHLTAKAPLKRSLSSWQISLIAIGGSIGSGLFIGSGGSFAKGGPAGVVIGFAVVGVMMFCTMHSMGELAVHYPVNGAFLQYVSRFVDPAWSLAMGWNYAISWVITFPLELISASITLGYWDTDNNGATNVSKAAWVALFWAACVILNLFGAKGYGYGEAVLSIIKVVAIIGFCIFAIVTTCGGYSGSYGPATPANYSHDLTTKYIGGHFWHHPGAFHAGVKGVFAVLVNAAFAFSGTELCCLAAAETANPSKALPRAVKQVFWRVLLFYIVSLTLVGCLVPHDDNRLGTTHDGRASPFVIAISNAHVKALPSIFNVVICLSVLSVGNSSIYAASRSIASLAAQGFAPQILGYIDREGRPLMGIAVVTIFGLMCFLAASSEHTVVFNWLLALCGLSGLFTWGSLNLAHLRFRLALRAQGRSTSELSFKASGGMFTSSLGLLLNFVVICLQFWIALYGVGAKKPNAEKFFEAYLSVPVVIVCYICARLYLRQKSWWVKLSEADLDTGLRNSNIEEITQAVEDEKNRISSKGLLYRIYYFWC